MQIIVMGPPHAGTSVVSRLLNLMGAYLGPEGTFAVSDDDHEGNRWQRRDILDLNTEVLAAVGSDRDGIPVIDPETDFEEVDRGLLARADRLRLDLDSHRPWVVNDPRMCLLFPWWQSLLEFPVVVHVHRSPASIARVFEDRHGVASIVGVAFWEYFTRRAMASTAHVSPVILDIDDLIGDPVATVQRLHGALENRGVGGLRIPHRREISTYVDPDRFHLCHASAEHLSTLSDAQESLLHHVESLASSLGFDETTEQVIDQDGIPASAEVLAQYADHRMVEAKRLALEETHREQTNEHEELHGELTELRRETDAVDREALAAYRYQVTRQEEELREVRRKLESASQRGKGLEARVQKEKDRLRAMEEQLKRAMELQTTLTSLEAECELRHADQRELRSVLDDIERSLSYRLSLVFSAILAAATLRFGRAGAIWDRLTSPPPPRRDAEDDRSPTGSSAPAPTVEIAVCIHNALDDVRRCIDSVLEHSSVPYRLILVNDGSGEETTQYLRQVAEVHEQVIVLESPEASGYTRAANRGLRAAQSGELVVLLNSDTIVGRGWLEGLLKCAHSDDSIGIVGPLSNAATYQSVPERFSDKGDWEINELPSGWDVDRMARFIASISNRRYPRVPFLNGFCFAIKRSLIDAIGEFDESSFPRGYGEENDYCLRAQAAGFQLVVADDVYVFHAKSKSYGHEVRKELSKAGREALHAKHDPEEIKRRVEAYHHNPELAQIRKEVAEALPATPEPRSKPEPVAAPAPTPVRVEVAPDAMRVLFLLPVASGGGGVHSIVEDVLGMRSLGCDARIAINQKYRDFYAEHYSKVDPRVFHPYVHDDLVEYAGTCHAVVATIFTSVRRLKDIVEAHPHVLPAYYIQDYEPWFVPEGSDLAREALESYTLIPDMVSFAKTDWLCRTVKKLHGIEVHKVAPGLDTALYHPPANAPEDGNRDGGVRVVAMVRPRTPRRGAASTMRVFKQVRQEVGDTVRLTIFGCNPDDEDFLALDRDFDFEHLGMMKREDVADLLRVSDVCVDFSTYQAFGRTALEAMACGCAAIVPAEGGADEYAVHEENSLVVDTSSEPDMVRELTRLVTDDELRKTLIRRGLDTAMTYSLAGAGATEMNLLRTALLERRGD